MARFWQSSDGQIRQPEFGTPEWTEHLRSHLKRMKDSYGPLDAVQIKPHDVLEHTIPYDDTKTQFYRRLLKDGQKTLPIVVEERPEGGYKLVDGVHRLGAAQLLNKPVHALVVRHSLQKMAIKDIRMGRRIAVAPGHILGYTRFDYSHTLPSTMTSEGYRLNVYHDPTSAPNEERFMMAVLTHPKGSNASTNFPNSVGSVSGHLQTNGHFTIGDAHIDEAHRGGKGVPMYESLMSHAARKFGATTVVGREHSTLAHKVHQKLALKHGMDYEGKESANPAKGPSGEYDGHYGPYSYAIKGEEEMAKAIGPFIASMMLHAAPGDFSEAPKPKHEIAATMYKPWSAEGLHPDMEPIAHLESSWGKNIAHGKGKNEMDTAFGALGFKPQTALEEYNRSKNIQKVHPNLSDPQAFLNEFRGNPKFYNEMASQHFARLKKLHGTAEKAAYAWRWGSTAAANATPETVEAEPYVQKYKALKSVKKLGKSQRDKESIRVVSVAAFQNGLALFGLRDDKKKWCMPGGHLEPGEDKLDAAKRELLEETSLIGYGWEYLGEGTVPGKDITVYCYKCHVDEEPNFDEDPDCEFTEFQWVDLQDIPDKIRENLHNKYDINLELQGIDYELSKSEDEFGEPLVKMPVQSELHSNFTTSRGMKYIDQALNDGATVNTNELGELPHSSFQAQGKQFNSPANGQKVYHHVIELPNSVHHTLSLSPDPREKPMSYMDVSRYKTMGNPEGKPTVELSYTDPPFSGFGIGTHLYQHALKHHGSLQSDGSVSRSANKVWNKLGGNPDNKVTLGEQGVRASRHQAEYVGKSEDLEKAAKKPKISPEQKNLVVQHNMSANGLEHAEKLGGLPAPSIAIAHKNHPLTGFGEISLVGGHDLVDPAQHPVFDADIYSPRQPRSEYKYSDKKMAKLTGDLRPHFKAIGSDWVSSLGDEFKRYGPAMTRHGSYNIAEGMKHAYLKEKGVQIPEIRRDVPVSAPWVAEPSMQNFFKEHGKDSNYAHDGDYSKKLGQAAKESIDSWAKNVEGLDPEEQKWIAENAHKEFINPDTGEVWFGKSPRVFKDHGNLGQQEADPHKMRDWVNAKVKEMGEDDFHDWSEKKLEHLNEGQYIPKYSAYSGNMRRVPYTIDNILKEMKGNPRQGENFNYGLGSIRAGGAKKFKDLEQMRQHQGQILSHEDFETVKNHMGKRWDELNEELAPYHGTKMNSMSALGEAISESYKRGKYLGSQLKLSGFDHVPPEVQRKVNEFAQDLIRMPTEYFEAKPQRVVGIHEFKGAAVPKNVHPRTIERLQRNGIQHIVHYDPDVKEDRARAINEIAAAQKLHLSEDEFYGETFLKAEDFDNLSKAVKPANSPAVEKVWRLQNAQGQGPYASGDMTELYGKFPKEEANDANLPATQEDFHPAVYAAHTSGQAHSGFKSAGDAEKWFGPERLKALFQMGYQLHEMPAKKVWPGKSGKQVLFIPHANLTKNEFDWFSDDAPGKRIFALKSAKPNEKLLQMALDDEHPDVRAFAAQHPTLSFEQLFNVLSHTDPETRLAALKNPNITAEHLEFAQHDPDIAHRVMMHPLFGHALAKNIGFVEFPKMGSHVHTHPMPMNVPDAKDRKKLMGDQKQSVSGGKLFFNINTNPNKGLPGKQRKMSGYVLTNDAGAFKGRMDHEAQHSVFTNLHQRHGTHAYHAAVEHVLGALSTQEKQFLNLLNPQLKNYPQSSKAEEVIAYMQNFLQDPARRQKQLADFAPNGRRLTEVGQRRAHGMVKDMWKRMRNRAKEFGPEHIEEYKNRIKKSDTELVDNWPQLIKEANLIGYNVVEDMAGKSLIDQNVLKAAEFLSGKKCDMMKFRRAFWQEEDQFKAALIAVELEPTDENVKALKSIADLQDVKKSNIDDTIKTVQPVFPEDKKVAEAIQRGIDSRTVQAPELEGKHVGGIRTVEDPKSKEVFLMKPGSGAPSPARGVRQQSASPSEREACFYAVAKLLGLQDRMVETYLLNVDNKYVAAMRMLPKNWTNLEKLKFQNKTLPASVLEKYRITGELHTWAILDYILGNPDRHGQNLMVGPAEDNYPVVLIDHGSALAGEGFDPANDEDSFVPYYLRAWNQKSFKNTDDAGMKLKIMPKTSDTGRKHIEEFIMKLNPSEIEGILVRHGVDPSAILARVEKVKHLLSNGILLDEGVNHLWVV